MNIYSVAIVGPEPLNWYVKADSPEQAKAKAKREVRQLPGKWECNEVQFIKLAYRENEEWSKQR